MFLIKEPYSPGNPVENDVEEWQILLAHFYAEQANKLLREREETLNRLCAIASRVHRLGGKTENLSSRFPRLRKPWFKH